DLDAAERGLARIVEHGAEDISEADAWQNLGVVRFYRADLRGSVDAYRRARRGYAQLLGAEHPRLGLIDSDIGESLAASGDHEGALAAYEAALRNFEAALPSDHLDFALAYKGRGQVQLELGQVAAARRDLEHALSLHERSPGEPVERADVEFSLARVLLRSGERGRALELARHAQAGLLELGHAGMAASITSWLSEHE
ncbi:MAG: tetratricopeptide repeat protein, partial [Myxococcales bacterium]|nr:tetratricopeptide repeat protein [Myxococcales bacterium]